MYHFYSNRNRHFYWLVDSVMHSIFCGNMPKAQRRHRFEKMTLQTRNARNGWIWLTKRKKIPSQRLTVTEKPIHRQRVFKYSNSLNDECQENLNLPSIRSITNVFAWQVLKHWWPIDGKNIILYRSTVSTHRMFLFKWCGSRKSPMTKL